MVRPALSSDVVIQLSDYEKQLSNEHRKELKDMDHHIEDILLQPSGILLLFYEI